MCKEKLEVADNFELSFSISSHLLHGSRRKPHFHESEIKQIDLLELNVSVQ